MIRSEHHHKKKRRLHHDVDHIPGLCLFLVRHMMLKQRPGFFVPDGPVTQRKQRMIFADPDILPGFEFTASLTD